MYTKGVIFAYLKHYLYYTQSVGNFTTSHENAVSVYCSERKETNLACPRKKNHFFLSLFFILAERFQGTETINCIYKNAQAVLTRGDFSTTIL